MLKKKHCAINYHRVREAIAGNIVNYVYIDSRKNIADCLTKPLPGNMVYGLVKPRLFENPGETMWLGKNIKLEGDRGSEIKDSHLMPNSDTKEVKMMSEGVNPDTKVVKSEKPEHQNRKVSFDLAHGSLTNTKLVKLKQKKISKDISEDEWICCR